MEKIWNEQRFCSESSFLNLILANLEAMEEGLMKNVTTVNLLIGLKNFDLSTHSECDEKVCSLKEFESIVTQAVLKKYSRKQI